MKLTSRVSFACLLALAPSGIAAGPTKSPVTLPNGPFVEETGTAIVPPPPPPPKSFDGGPVEITPTMRAMYGQWRLVARDGALVPVNARYDFVLWGTTFLAQKGCLQISGQLLARSDGQVEIERYSGSQAKACREPRLGAEFLPFDASTIRFDKRGDDLFAEASGKRYQFRRVITDTGRASDDFMRGEWLLAKPDESPLRGAEQTAFRIDDRGVAIDAAHCDYWSNGLHAAESYRMRLGGSLTRTSICKASTLGDKWAKSPDAYELIAVPIEGRMDMKLRGKRIATLVPAVRFPELAENAPAVPANDWATRLATFIGSLPREEQLAAIARVLAVDQAPDELDHLPPIVVIAQFEGIVAADRGDGLSLDYLYRVKQSWRGDRQPAKD